MHHPPVVLTIVDDPPLNSSVLRPMDARADEIGEPLATTDDLSLPTSGA
jgi:hypothetical protein